MFYRLYDLPNWAVLLLVTVAAVAVAWCLIFLLRPVTTRLFSQEEDRHNDLIELVMTGTGLFYGLLLGLIAAASYTSFSDSETIVNNEATKVTALYRDVSNYPEPVRTQLRGDLEGYARYVINEAWPLQERGEIPRDGAVMVSAMQNRLAAFEPVTEGDKILHAEAFRQFNEFVELRQQRLNSVTTSMPGPLWWVLVTGAVINLVLMAMLSVRRLTTHLVISGLFALFVAMMIFLIVSMDNPFRGEFSVQPDAFRTLQTLMTGS
jgi:hypothetical protein